MTRGTCLEMCNFTKWRVHECVCVCVKLECVLCISWCWCMTEWAYYKTNVRFFLFFFFFLFCLMLSQQVLLALEVVLGLAFSITDVTYVSGHGVFGNIRVSRSSQMNLCKWLFDNEVSLICQLCLFKQTLPCRATQSLERADSTSENKVFSA